MLSSHELRTIFLKFYEKKGHVIVPSHSLVPLKDQSLLFVNAGMVPFKENFRGQQTPQHTNVASIQRCVRAGGKHNDLENVGYTARHHTFFEMLGNFSFGGYFKREAIQFAFEFLTDVLKIPSEKLWVTVYKEDTETASIWLDTLKFDANHLSYCGDQDNFWMMGETGPCGPCTEIFYDHGPNVPGKPPGSLEDSGDRFVEIWNLVFMQYDQKVDGERIPLPKPCIDTGMGLERLAAVMQGVASNYETDLFQPFIQVTAKKISAPLPTLQVIADHIRAASFLILDGITPTNEGRGYVLRRIIRRALRHGYQSGMKEPFLYQLIPTVVTQMKAAYPALCSQSDHIQEVLKREEGQFLHTLHHGLQYFENAVSSLTTQHLPGELVFKLYDTYGFPSDLTADLARELGLSWDEAGFEMALEKQKQRSRASQYFSSTVFEHNNLSTLFKGYTQLSHKSRVIGLFDENNQAVTELVMGRKGQIILDETPFYAEAGGQVGDQGELWQSSALSKNSFIVLDTSLRNHAYLHTGYVKEGKIQVGDSLYSQVDLKRRQAICCHHSATHLLHAALREKFGTTLSQKGSLVTPDRLRFDFQYALPLTLTVTQEIENRVNQAIQENLVVETQLMNIEEARQKGAIALFDEKYADQVRVLRMGNFSQELCGGTHVSYTGELGYFKIIEFYSIAAGVKRIEAVVAEAAVQWVSQLEARERALATLLGTKPEKIISRVEKQIAFAKQQNCEIDKLQHSFMQYFARQVAKEATQIGHTTLLLVKLPEILVKKARLLVDQVISFLPPHSVVIVGCQLPSHLSISIGVAKEYSRHISAKEIVALLIPLLKGKGGGRPDFAEVHVSSQDSYTLDIALKAVSHWLKEKNLPIDS